MATAAGTLVIGGFTTASGKATDYSGAGLSSEADPAVHLGPQVDLSIPTERSALMPGVIAAGTRSATTVAASGTSSASPQAARLLALSQIAAPLPNGASHADVLARLAGLPQAVAVSDPGNGPSSRLRLGEFVLQT